MKMQNWTKMLGLAGVALAATTATAGATEPVVSALTAAEGSSDTGVIVSMAVVALAAFGMVMFGRDRQPEPVRVKARR